MGYLKNNFYVITGGPGAGKTSLIEALGYRGFNVIGETGRIIIKERISRGLAPRPAQGQFGRLMFERDFQAYLENLDTMDELFFDRSFVDSAMILYKSGRLFSGTIDDIIVSHRFNKKIFMTPPWPEIYCNDDERDQSFEDATNIFENLLEWYKLKGYQPIMIPKIAVMERVNFILASIK